VGWVREEVGGEGREGREEREGREIVHLLKSQR
jgi:hypothetical protein